ncbi:ACP S-malonyltransferase [Hutsoniella sourekii]
MKLAVIFNGQGGQYPGMGADFKEAYPQAQAVYQAFESVLGEPVADWAQSQERLSLTRYAQPAILATSLAIYNSIKDQLPAISYMAGLSLGEYTALTAAGYLTLESAADLINQRGLIMGQVCQDLSETSDVAMGAAVRLPLEAVQSLVKDVQDQGHEIYLANMNASTQTILAGRSEALAAYNQLAKSQGDKKLMPLKVEGPFHSPLMEGACQPFRQVLENTDFQAGQVPVISNTTLEVHQPATIKETLVRHLVEPVHWKQTMDYFQAQGVTHVVQIGPGDTLVKLAKREDYDFDLLLVDKISDIEVIETVINKGVEK